MKLSNWVLKKMMRFSSPERRANLLKKINEVQIGEKCAVFDNVSFGSEPYLIKIGSNVRLTSGVKLITHDGGVYVLRNNGMLKNADKFGKIDIGNNVHVGVNAVIMPGVSIGSNVVIGAGAVVTKDIPSNSIAVGVPAKVIKTLEDYYEKNKSSVDFTKQMSSNEKKQFLLNKYIN